MRRLHHDSTGKPDEDLQKAGGAGPPDARVCAGAHPWDHRAQRLRKDHTPSDDMRHRRADRGEALSRRQPVSGKGITRFPADIIGRYTVSLI